MAPASHSLADSDMGKCERRTRCRIDAVASRTSAHDLERQVDDSLRRGDFMAAVFWARRRDRVTDFVKRYMARLHNGK